MREEAEKLFFEMSSRRRKQLRLIRLMRDLCHGYGKLSPTHDLMETRQIPGRFQNICFPAHIAL